MPLSAIEDQQILDGIVGKVEAISHVGNGTFAVRIALARATAGNDAGQFVNMLFGNTRCRRMSSCTTRNFPTTWWRLSVDRASGSQACARAREPLAVPSPARR